jgi:hypothetical protein
MAADLLTRVGAEIEQRLAALRPAVAEYRRLLGAADALGLGPDGTPVARRAPTTSGQREAERRAQAPSRASKPPSRASTPLSRASTPLSRASTPPQAPARPPAPRRGAAKARAARPRQPRLGAVEQAIMAALEHGSHTLGELGVVTAMSAPELRGGVRQLLGAGRIVRSSREGRAAYALSGSE